MSVGPLPPFVRGMLLILAAIFLFDVMGAIIKFMGEGYSPQQLSMYRNVFGLIPSLLLLVTSRDWHRAGRPLIMRQWRLGLARGGFVALAQFCLYSAVIHLEFATATTLALAGPLFVTALSVPVLRHKVGVWRWSAVIVGFAGIVLIMQPGSEIFTPYALLPIGAAFGYASATVLLKLIDDDAPSPTINLYSTGGGLLGSIVIVLATGGYRPVEAAHEWLWLIAMGIAGGCAVLSMITAYRLAAPSSLAPFEYFGIPFSFAIGWMVFDEAPFERLFPGALLIVAGGLLVIWRQHRLSRAGSPSGAPGDQE